MDFRTTLTAEQVKQRLEQYARPLKSSAYLTEQQFSVKWNKDNSFYLLKTGGFPSVRPVLPFVGRVEADGEKNIITGKFTLAKNTKISLLCFCGFAWLLFLLIGFTGFLKSGADTVEKLTFFIVVTIALLIWTMLCFLLLRYVPALFQKKQQAEVIEFIEKYLCSL